VACISIQLGAKKAQTRLPSEGRACLLFAGDLFLKTKRTSADTLDPTLRVTLEQSDLAVLNFEGSVPGPRSLPVPKAGPHLMMDPHASGLAKGLGFNAATLANNHIMDYGVDGLGNTLELLAKQGLETVGAGLTQAEAVRPLRIVLPGNQRVQIFSFCEREFGTSEIVNAGAAWLSSPFAEDCVKKAKLESDVVIVCAHGGNELMPLPSMQRRDQLRSLIAAGADVVIGHHPHVPQAWEQWGGGIIFYSLGNFYFDSLDGPRAPCKDWGYMVQVGIESRQVRDIEIVPFERVDDRVIPLGAARNPEAHFNYLERLACIVQGKELAAYWQTLAVDRFLRAYAVNVAGLLPWKLTIDSSLRTRARETARGLSEIWGLWWPRRLYNGKPVPLSDIQSKTLNALNLIRCESHRWVFETALSVLAGESEDLRTESVRRELQEMALFSGYNL
jgi:poly-gamma-glutamate synthesis protein (capsule biosynthesis protein)